MRFRWFGFRKKNKHTQPPEPEEFSSLQEERAAESAEVDDILKEQMSPSRGSDYQSGMRQMFTGVGLAIFLGIIIGKIGFGIGALVFFIGLGKWFIARQSGNTGNDPFNNPSNNRFNNNSNSRDYE